MSSAPGSINTWLDGGAAASHREICGGIMFGQTLIPSPLKPRNIRPSVRINGRAWLAGRALRRQIHRLRANTRIGTGTNQKKLGRLVRDKIKAYSWVGGDRPAEVIDGIKKLRGIGFDTFKLNGCEEMGIIDNSRAVDAAVNTVAQIREAFGNEIEFGLDFHGRVSAPMAKVLIKELEPYRPLFIEEPVLAEQAEYYPRLAAQTHIPIAAGERMFSRFEFKRVLEAGGVAILQPDLSHAGGITECYKIAGMAEAYDVGLAPHCPLGPIALAACLHVDFVSHNAVFQEQSMGIHYNKGAELLDFVKNKEDFNMEGGFFKPLMKPGLGVEIDEARVIELSKNAPDWRNPLWRYEDGSVAEW